LLDRISAYIPPRKTGNSTINYIKLAAQHKQNHELILLGDLNVNINDKSTHNIQQDATVALVSRATRLKKTFLHVSQHQMDMATI
jgi:exonuclease III